MPAHFPLPADIGQIQQFIPHRFPFLMVDRVVELEPGRRILAWKNVTVNEGYFQGHFPSHPVMPGVLVIEALAQAGGILTNVGKDSKPGEEGGRLSYLVKIDNAKFSRMVEPGDRLELEVVLKRVIRNMVQMCGTARVDGQQVACADILCAEVARDDG